MGLNIPNVSEVVYPAQGYPDDCDFQISRAQAQGCGYIAATAHPNYRGSPTALVSGLTVTVDATTTTQCWVPVLFAESAVTLPAASSTDRKDLVYIDGTGTLQYLMGTPCAVSNWTPSSGVVPPNKPDLPGNGVAGLPGQAVAVCEVYVPAGASSLTSDNIVDKSAGVYPTFMMQGTRAATGQPLKPTMYGSAQITGSAAGDTPTTMLMESSTQANYDTLPVYTTGTYSNSTKITVGSTSGLSVGMGVSDITNSTYVTAGSTIATIGTGFVTITGGTVNASMSGDLLLFLGEDGYDFNAGAWFRNWTLNGAAVVVGNQTQGDGIYCKANNAVWAFYDPNITGTHVTTGNALNVYAGTLTNYDSLHAGASQLTGSGANGCDSVGLNMSRFSSAWAIKIYGQPSAYPNVWSSGTAYAVGDTARSSSGYHCFRSRTAGNSNNALPAVGASNTNWDYVGTISGSALARGISPLIEVDNLKGPASGPGADTGSLWVVDHGSQTADVVSITADNLSTGHMFVTNDGTNNQMAIDAAGLLNFGPASLVTSTGGSGTIAKVLKVKDTSGNTYYLNAYPSHA